MEALGLIPVIDRQRNRFDVPAFARRCYDAASQGIQIAL
jgi:hypothetical protein